MACICSSMLSVKPISHEVLIIKKMNMLSDPEVMTVFVLDAIFDHQQGSMIGSYRAVLAFKHLLLIGRMNLLDPSPGIVGKRYLA